jgi:uncharacterized damage-inducible protein DinB
MKEILIQYAGYNAWANKRIIDTLLTMDPEAIEKEVVSSFSSLKKTVLHIWGAEFIWLQRLQLAEHPIWIPAIFTGSVTEACSEWQNVSISLQEFISKQFDDKSFEHTLQYYSLKKQSFKNPVYAVLLHVFNHSTYHRGQLVTMLRQVGASKIPEMDFISFVRK